MFEELIKETIAKEIAMQFERFFSTGLNQPEKERKPYSINDIVTRFGVSRQTVGRWEEKGKITGTRIGRRVFYPAADVEALTSNRKNSK